jgi:hypothetical protein
LDDVGLAWLANVYRAAFRASGGRIGPREADQLELWEIAVLLGTDGWEEAKDDPYAHLRARDQAIREGRPEPTFQDAPPDPSMATLIDLFGTPDESIG